MTTAMAIKHIIEQTQTKKRHTPKHRHTQNTNTTSRTHRRNPDVSDSFSKFTLRFCVSGSFSKWRAFFVLCLFVLNAKHKQHHWLTNINNPEEHAHKHELRHANRRIAGPQRTYICTQNNQTTQTQTHHNTTSRNTQANTTTPTTSITTTQNQRKQDKNNTEMKQTSNHQTKHN